MVRSKGKRQSPPRKALSIFQRMKLTPTQLRTVAERRLGDAEYLCKSSQNARANGAMYLGGLAVECFLKAKLLEKFPWLKSPTNLEKRSRDERLLWSLCYQRHLLDELLARLPEVTQRISAAEQRGRRSLSQGLTNICATWTIFVRYSPMTATIDQAKSFLNQVKEIKPWLR